MLCLRVSHTSVPAESLVVVQEEEEEERDTEGEGRMQRRVERKFITSHFNQKQTRINPTSKKQRLEEKREPE